MAGLQDSQNNDVKKYSSEQFSESFTLPTYHDDKDFDEAFKNLLRPIESISKRNQCEPLQYDLLKELDSYLNHLRENSDGGSSVFVEAALMFQNVVLIYQKRADQIIDFMTKLIGKFRAYRLNQKENYDTEDVEGNTNKKKEKKIKFYHAFEPIKGQIFGTLKNYDCKVVNLSKKQTLSKIVLNANIKVDNKYNKIMPYICIGNGENIGKKYDFMIINPLNRDLAVNEEFDCPTKEDKKNLTPLNYLKSTDPLPINLMDVDEVDSNDILPSTPDPVIFDQTVTNDEEIRVQQAISPVNVMNLSKIPPMSDDDIWDTITNPQDDTYADKPIVKKRVNKKDDDTSSGGVWLPSYTIGELQCQLIKLKSGISIDSVFIQLIHKAQEAQRSELLKIRNKRIIDKEKQLFGYHDEEMERRLKSGEEPGFKGFDDNPIDTDGLDNNFPEDFNELDEPIKEEQEENYETYQKNLIDMKKHEENQLEIMNEQLEMRKRVQVWHDNLRPILAEEEKRTAFDIHEYGTRVLNSFDSVGEQKSFKDLVGGLGQEEVARYFLSTLMMTNTYNLKIKSSDDNGEMKIELLKKERHHEELQVNIGNQVKK